MYMYYLLGYRLLGNNDDSMYSNQSDVGRPAYQGITVPLQSYITQRSKIFRSMNYIQRVQVRSCLSVSVIWHAGVQTIHFT